MCEIWRKIYGDFGYVTITFAKDKELLAIKLRDGIIFTYNYNELYDKTETNIIATCIQNIEDIGLL